MIMQRCMLLVVEASTPARGSDCASLVTALARTPVVSSLHVCRVSCGTHLGAVTCWQLLWPKKCKRRDGHAVCAPLTIDVASASAAAAATAGWHVAGQAGSKAAAGASEGPGLWLVPLPAGTVLTSVCTGLSQRLEFSYGQFRRGLFFNPALCCVQGVCRRPLCLGRGPAAAGAPW